MLILFIFGTIIKYLMLLMHKNNSWVNNYGNFCITSVCLLCYLRDDLVDFVYIRYNNQVPHVVDACKIAFCSLPTLSNYEKNHQFDVFVVASRDLRGE